MPDFPTALVAGTDGSPAAARALRWAARAARQRKRELRIVHVLEDPWSGFPHLEPAGKDIEHVLAARGHRILRRAVEVVQEVAPDLRPEPVLRRGRVPEWLATVAEDAALLVLGSPQARVRGRILPGSVALSLAAQGKCPVAVVRPHVAEEEAPATGPIVAGVDGSPASERALAIAFDEAAWRNAPLTAVHCWDDRLLSALFEENHWTFDGGAERGAEEILAERLAGWAEKYPEVPVRRVVVRGHPAEGLLDLADGAQLLVVGGRGRGGLAGLLLGSTSQAALSYALCPVVVARPMAAES
ncbi:universal stress protein [Amycolatopsis panacis]|uniref:Universal stress protein n=1 Tax=Amycolatopsis panacis TaxID=2340917 RepID=A0A419I6Q9_9PSEU|nr:universal stress protein [Amycolatopsis panacis]RJQ87256.1 universal stress protein [Amycolatopsis panacis]